MPDSVTKQYLEMSDEDFLSINSPAAADEEAGSEPVEAVVEAGAEGGTPAATQAGDKAEEPAKEPGDEEAAAADPPTQDPTPHSETEPDPAKADDNAASAKDPEGDQKIDPKPDPEAAAATKDGDKDADPAGSETDAKTESEPVDYEKFFKQVMTPFKANGRSIELKTPEEAIRLMQMGAGYGRKIQDMQPHLKTLRMLEKNDLLDPARLSFLIDINQKNPEAIKKLIKESGIDPLDLNIEDNVGYKPTNHSVSDKEMAFQEVLSDIQGHDTGQETLRIVNQTWDQESKSALWDQPQILSVIQSQRENGIYDQISAEIDRQKLLGQIPNNTPFLHAYKLAGDHLQATNGFKNLEGQTDPIQNQQAPADTPAPQPHVIATRPAAPKAQVQNGEKAAAASPTKSSANRGKGQLINPLEMADDDFMKQFKDRL